MGGRQKLGAGWGGPFLPGDPREVVPRESRARACQRDDEDGRGWQGAPKTAGQVLRVNMGVRGGPRSL